MKRPSVDVPLAFAVWMLFVSGLIMVFSASSMIGNFRFGSLTYFFQKQVFWSILALPAMIFVSRFDYRRLKKGNSAFWLVFVSVMLLAGLYVFGHNVNGATRWYNFKVLRFQPTEMAKLSLIIYTSYYLSKRESDLHNLKKGLLPLGMVVGSSVLLILFQPDLSSALMIVLVIGVMIFLSPVPLKHLLGAVLPAIPLVIFVISRKPYQLKRIVGWWNALHDPALAPYQLRQSLIGIGNGGWFGQGLGQSKQKFLFLPDSHTDFIFSILSEEFGYIGVTIVLLLFLLIFYRGIYLARKAPDKFGMYLATGITLNITLYAFINAGVVSALLPTTGLPMPFFSYGGSNLFFMSVAVGILLNISRRSRDALSGEWQQRIDRQNIILTAE